MVRKSKEAVMTMGYWIYFLWSRKKIYMYFVSITLTLISKINFKFVAFYFFPDDGQTLSKFCPYGAKNIVR